MKNYQLLCLLLLLTFAIAQQCPQLCTTNCSINSCTSCYQDFTFNSAMIPASFGACSCPDGYFMTSNTTYNLCNFCPINCLTCSAYSKCVSCISGFQLSNNFSCIPKIYNVNSWVSKNVSYDFTSDSMKNNIFSDVQIVVSANNTPVDLTAISANNTYFVYCSKMPNQQFFGVNHLNWNSKFLKIIYGLPPHDWAHIRFQVAAIDSWGENALIVEINSINSYQNTILESIASSFSLKFNSQKRSSDFCLSASFSDSLGIGETTLSHRSSSIKFRIRPSVSDSLNQSYTLSFALREIFVRVGTCPRNCAKCNSSSICVECIFPFVLNLSSSTCICNTSNTGGSNSSVCSFACTDGYFLQSNNCLKCQSILANCLVCSSSNAGSFCQKCYFGYFLGGDGTCVDTCPLGFGYYRNFSSVLSGVTTYQDKCLACNSSSSSACTSCIQNVCLACATGAFRHAGQCTYNCPTQTYLQDAQCVDCPLNCLTCSASACLSCSTGFSLSNGSCQRLCFNSNTILSSSSTNSCQVTCNDTNCLYCYSPAVIGCTICKSSFFVWNGTCSQNCPTSTYLNNSVCIKCSFPCDTCSNNTICLTCKTGYFLSTTACVKQCPYYTYSDVSTKTCKSCQPNCALCVTDQYCLRCQPPLVLVNGSCLSGYNCPLGQYFDGTFQQCTQCMKNCDICSANRCLKCSNAYFLDKSRCVSSCPSSKFGFIESISFNGAMVPSNKCKWKSPLCESYNMTTMSGECSTCSFLNPALVSYSLNNLNVCKFTCLDGFGPTSTLTCSPCPNNCRKCHGDTLQCYQCYYNYVLNAKQLLTTTNLNNSTCLLNYCGLGYFTDSLQCQTCTLGCQTCLLDGSCFICSAGYLKMDKYCVDMRCNTTLTQYYNTITSLCASCSSPCYTCASTSMTCTSCLIVSGATPSFLFNNTCVSACPNGLFADAISATCRKCDPKCFTCNNILNCSSCQKSYYLLSFYSADNVRCVSECPQGFYVSVSNNTCNLCFKDCQSCYGASEFQCLSCYPNFKMDDSRCVYFCDIQKFVDDEGYCDWCHPSCLRCSGPTDRDCLNCAAGLYYYMSSCYYGLCPAATFVADPELKICQDCQFGCRFCYSPNFCYACIYPYYLYRGWCYPSCPGNTISQLVNELVNQVQSTDGVCSDCLGGYSSRCLECDGSSCLTCNYPYYLYLNSTAMTQVNNLLVKEYCVSGCPAGTYLLLNSNPQCKDCFMTCQTCTSYSNCLSCITGYYLSAGVCTLICPPNTFIMIPTNYCFECPTVCLSCSSLPSCTSCNQTTSYKYLASSSAGTTCVTTCPSGFYPDTSYYCVSCPFNCLDCVHQSHCTRCASQYILTDGFCRNSTQNYTCDSTKCDQCSQSTCLKCKQPYLLFFNSSSSTQCLLQCPIQYFNNFNKCSRCDSSCLTCTNFEDNCTSCKQGLYLSKSNCVNKCPQGFIASASNICAPCPSNCLICSNPNNCLACRDDFLLFGNLCVKDCPIGYRQDHDEDQCKPCGSNCLQCSSRKHCNRCIDNYYLLNKTCSSFCPLNYVVQIINQRNVCTPCAYPCTTCTGIPTKCTTCTTSYVLTGSTCTINCQTGFYKILIYSANKTNYNRDSEDDNDNRYSNKITINELYKCKACSDSCLTCETSAANCLSCNNLTILLNGNCLANCPAGTFRLNLTCASCPSFCVSCTNSSVCLLCSSNSFLYVGSCLSACPTGFYGVSSYSNSSISSTCSKCISPCLNCKGPTAYDCTSCTTGLYLSNSSICLSVCPAATFADNILNICQTCRYSCKTCITFDNCTQCNPGFNLSATNLCVNSTNTTQCTIMNCLVCDPSINNICKQCFSGYNVLSSSSNSSCVKVCPNGTYSQLGVCQSCPSSCVNCSNAVNCYSCKQNYYLYSGTCRSACPSSTLPSNGICIQDPCSSYISLTLFTSTLSLSLSLSNCSQCYSPYVLVSKTYLTFTLYYCSLSCPNGTALASSICVNCSTNCFTCSSPQTCNLCTNGYSLYNGKCWSACPSGTYFVANVCYPCQSSNCINCQYNSTVGQACLLCNGVSLLSNGKCVLDCPNGTYANQLYSICLKCPTNCAQCSNATFCTLCTTTTYLNKVSGVCSNSCGLGTFKSNSTCQACSMNCVSCQSLANCSICSIGYSVYAASNTSICVNTCPSGSYANLVSIASTSSTFSSCLNCVSPCLTCSSSTQCTSCLSTYMLFQSSCLLTCPAGYYKISNSNVAVTANSKSATYYSTASCSQCISSCATCINSSSICQTCFSGFSLDSQHNCISNCSSPTSYYSVLLRQCNNCSILCYSCYGPDSTNCLSCKLPLVLYSSSCYTSCPIGFYQSTASQCLACDISCSSCVNLANNCTACSSNLLLQIVNSKGQCLTACSVGSYFDTSSNTCRPCTTPCATCTGQSTTQCITCINNTYFLSNQCLNACPSGTVAQTSAGVQSVCQPCPSNCTVCIVSNSSIFCTTCVSPLLLANGACYQGCPDGFYLASNGNSCSKCLLSNCQSCIFNSTFQAQCTKCQYSYYLMSDTFGCVSSCPSGYVLSGLSCNLLPTCNGYMFNGYCLSNCPVGTYADSTAKCNPCSSPCASCTSTPTQCLSCITGTYSYDVVGAGSNVSVRYCLTACPAGYYASSTQCLLCQSPCLNCMLSNSALICTTCPSGQFLLGTTCITACPSGYYSTTSASTQPICLICNVVCASCSTANSCTKCKNSLYSTPSCSTTNCLAGTFLDLNNICSNCSSNCLTCYGSSSSECVSCSNSLILLAGQCLSSCPLGYVNSNSTCLACASNCDTCIISGNSTDCQTCSFGYLKVEITNVCVLSCSQVSSSSISYYLSNNTCKQCSLFGCLTCGTSSNNAICLTCNSTTYFYNNICNQNCPASTFAVSSPSLYCSACQVNCTNCTSVTQCTVCSSGFYIYIGKCVPNCPLSTYLQGSLCTSCSLNCINCTNSTACTSCTPPYALNNAQCTNCITGFFYSSLLCFQCDPSCLTCSQSATNCLTCPSGTYFIVGQNICQANCPSGYYSDASTGTCLACSASCLTCNSGGCLSCGVNSFTIKISSEVSCTSSCPAGSYGDTSLQTCVNCSSSCSMCSSLSSCSNCLNNTSLYLGYCLVTCPTGFTSVNQICQPCSNGCKSCTSPTLCQQCNTNLIISNGSCIQPISNCSSGYYLNTLLNLCSVCYSTCKTCSNGGQSDCLSCFSGYTLINGICQTTCPANYYYNTTSASCQTCSSLFSNCLTCSSTSCLSCGTNYIVSTSGNCTSSCSVGSFFFNGLCLQCPVYCTACLNSNNCTSCVTGSFSYNSLCYQSCPQQTYSASGSCNACQINCMNCSINSSYCSSCITPFALYANTCIVSCPDGTYLNNYVCYNCSTSCLKCSGSSNCSLCSTPTWLMDGICRASCISGYYGSNQANVCIICVLPCTTCSSRSNCSSCLSNYTLVSNQCTNGCPNATYYDSASTSCKNCTLSNCNTCNSTNCYSCKNSYFGLSSNSLITSCVQTCPNASYPSTVTFNCEKCIANCNRCSNGYRCLNCSTGYSILSVATALSDSCEATCPRMYLQVITANIKYCLPCIANCDTCANFTSCNVCSSGYYRFFQLNSNQSDCTANCPTGYYNPIIQDGSGICGECPQFCLECLDVQTCTSCLNSTYVLNNNLCIPSNCVNCETCNKTVNKCQRCNMTYFLDKLACTSNCPLSFFNNEQNRECTACISNCLVCIDNSTCTACIDAYIYTSITGCINQAYYTYGVVGNMSGFTSNITSIVSTVYVTTSAGPMAFGEMSTTYFNIEFCQSLYFLGGNANNNSELTTFLNSLQTVSLTSGSSSSSSSSSSSGKKRLLTASQYTSSFLETNANIFILMGSFLGVYIAVLIFKRYTDSCCITCHRLHFYLNEICTYLEKRFKWIYFDFLMWMSYLPFLYFALLQLQAMNFQSALQAISSILAVIIIIVYPIYPLFVCYLLKQSYHLVCKEEIVEEEAIQGAQPVQKPSCLAEFCCPKFSLEEMSLSPFIYKVRRPVPVADEDFRYFTKANFTLIYYPLKYFRKFIFILIVAMCSEPLTSLGLLVGLTILFIVYMFVFRPREILYLIVDLIIQFVLLFFLTFMLIYVALDGSKIDTMSIIAHGIGFIVANLSLVVAIVLNIIAYYKILLCIIDLVRHLKDRAEEEEVKEKAKFNLKDQILEDQEKPEEEIMNDDKNLKGIKIKKVNDDSITEENDEDDYKHQLNIMHKLDDKELIFNGIDPSMLAKKQKQEEEEEIPDLKDSTIGNSRKKRRDEHRKKSQVQHEELSSEDFMGQSRQFSDSTESIEAGFIKERGNNKFKREVGKDNLLLEKGVTKDITRDKYKRNVGLARIESKFDQEDDSKGDLFNINTREAPKKKIENTQEGLFIDRKINKNNKAENLPEGNLIERQKREKEIRQKEIEELNLKERQLKKNNNSGKLNKEIEEVKGKERVKKQKLTEVFDQLEDEFNEVEQQNLKIEEAKAIERRKKEELKKYGQLGDFEEIEKVRMRQMNNKKIAANKIYRSSDEQDNSQQISQGIAKEQTSNKYKRNPNKQQAKQVDINARVVDFKTKKNQKNKPNYLEDQAEIDNIQFREIQGKKKSSKKEILENQKIESLHTVQREKRAGEKKQKKVSERELEQTSKTEALNLKKAKNLYGDAELDDSVEDRKKNNEQKLGNKDNLLNVIDFEEDTYEGIVKKNKDFEFKQPANKNKSSFIPDDQDFEDVSYSRPESKIERPKSRSKNGVLGVNHSDVSDNDDILKEARKVRNSSIQSQRKKGNLNVNEQPSEDDVDVPADSRRSKIERKNRSMRSGILKIDDKSDVEDVEEIKFK